MGIQMNRKVTKTFMVIFLNWKKNTFGLHVLYITISALKGLTLIWALVTPWIPCLNPFKPEFIIGIFLHYKPRIAVAILDL